MPLNIVDQPTPPSSDDDFLDSPPPVSTRVFLAAVSNGELDNVADYLQRQPELARSRDAGGASPLTVAILHEQWEIVDLLRRTPGIEVGWCEAAALGDVSRLDALLQTADQDLQQRSADGSTALGLAAFFGHTEAVRRLLDAGVDIAQVSDDLQHTTALHQAVAHRRADVALAISEQLLAAGAPVNAQQAGGFTPLHQAASRGRESIVDLLLQHGADGSLESDQGWTAADLARQRGHRLTALD